MPKKINIKGSIMPAGSEWIRDYGFELVTPRDVTEVLGQANGEEIEILINSPGGYTSAASEMYTAIRGYNGKVVAKIVGYACSAASWVALGADKIEISPTGLMMIHNSSSGAYGDYRDMDKSSDMLQAVDKSIRNALKIKTNKTDEEIKEIMDKETWFTAEDAIQNNLVDEIMFDFEPSNFSIDDLQIPNAKIINMIISKNKKERGKNVGDKKEKEVVDKVADELTTVKNKETEVTADAIKNNFKNVYDEIFNLGVESERERIKNIEDVAVAGFEEMTNKAKFETSITASDYAMNVLKAQKEAGNKFINDMSEDKKDVAVAPENSVNDEDEKEALINAIVNAANERNC